MSRLRLLLLSLMSLLATALLGLAVAHGHPLAVGHGHHVPRWERHALRLLGRLPGVNRWGQLADFLAVPVITAVVLISLALGALRRVLFRVVVLAVFAAAALVINDQILKPVVGETIQGSLSFPSGNVTAVCATALAMWIALYPVLGKAARVVTFILGAAWTLLMSVAVMEMLWHTPLDCVGSVFLSVGVVTGGAALLTAKPFRQPPAESDSPGTEPGCDELIEAGDSLSEARSVGR
jgi:hypothetical protein